MKRTLYTIRCGAGDTSIEDNDIKSIPSSVFIMMSTTLESFQVVISRLINRHVSMDIPNKKIYWLSKNNVKKQITFDVIEGVEFKD